MISHLKSYSVPLELLASEVEGEQPASIRSALILAMGEYSHAPAPAKSQELVTSVSRLYEQDPDSGVHSASEWLLRRWGEPLPEIPRTAQPHERGKRQWWINAQGQTMIVQPGPVTFTMGSPETEPLRDPIEDQHAETIPYSFAISAHEVTVEQFLRFDPKFDYVREIATPQCPINRVDWYAAARYCRWLSEQEGIEESQMCYPALESVGPKMELPDNFLSRTGYRLPTEAEWEFACRAGASTPWFFGSDQNYLIDYGWCQLNSQERTAPVGTFRPNAIGLFDVYGNIQEWCHDLSSVPIGDEVVAKLAQGADVRANERMSRGGSFKAFRRSTRSAKQMSFPSDSLFSFLGFRIARTLP
jgi:formylglycine-generating enzyme required for sulfatase activity